MPFSWAHQSPNPHTHTHTHTWTDTQLYNLIVLSIVWWTHNFAERVCHFLRFHKDNTLFHKKVTFLDQEHKEGDTIEHPLMPQGGELQKLDLYKTVLVPMIMLYTPCIDPLVMYWLTNWCTSCSIGNAISGILCSCQRWTNNWIVHGIGC